MRAFCNRRSVFLGSVVLLSLVTLLVGCATTEVMKTDQADAVPATPQKKQITQIKLNETDREAHVLVTGDQKLVFTAVKQPNPPAVIFYFPDTAVDVKEPIDTSFGQLITDIGITELTETGHTARLEIKLAADAPYIVENRENGLDIIIEKSADKKIEAIEETTTDNDQKVASKSSQAMAGTTPATILTDIKTTSSSEGIQVKVGLNGTIDQYKSFVLDQPPRIVFDLPNIKATNKAQQTIDVNSSWVKRIRHYNDAQKLRIVLETQPQYLDAFAAVPDATGLMIMVGAIASGDEATLQHVKYHEKAGGKSEVVVTTSRRVEYKIKRVSPRWLRLSLLNCNLPKDEFTVQDTSSNSGVVTAIAPVLETKQPGTAHIDIRLRETVPFMVKQDDGRLYVQLESPEPGSSAKGETSTTSVSVEAKDQEGSVKKEAVVEQRQKEGPKYAGEKIALDFYNTDIHNVFRILADISGQNFAIDKDVEGKVTLSLDNPVPWDQVLDLVLKMNQLDKRWDENIIRIATLKTLKAEDASRIDQIKAKRAEEEQADVVTEYILINYADATKDVKPHIEAILSQNGKLSVDTRSNLLILTDVPTVITRAKEIVGEIDNATPQVLIEARIVEADNSFSREIGLSWNAAWGIQADDPRAGIGPQRGFDRFGGTYGWDTAINFPFSIGTPMQLGFNIAKVAGTPLGLDARLQLLEINGNGRIISAPKVLTLDSQEAVITQGQEYPYFEESESGGRTVKFKKVELKLTVTPHITPDGRVSIRLKIEKKDVFQFIENVPVLNTKEAETEFLMNDRDTLVIGGIHKTTERLSQTGYPWLSKIPFLGWLFKTQNKELDKEELLIFISPKIRKMERRNAKTVTGTMG